MYMIRHYYKIIQFDIVIMVGHVIPATHNYFAIIIQKHFFGYDLA